MLRTGLLLSCGSNWFGGGPGRGSWSAARARWLLSHPGDEEAEFKTAKAGISYLQNVSW